MSNWKIAIPESTTNRVLNPSAETTGNFSVATTATITRSTTFQHYGLYSYRVETSVADDGIQIDFDAALSNAIHYATVRVAGTLPANWYWSLDNITYTAPTLLEQIDSTWALYGLQFPAAQANGATEILIRQNGAGSGDFYLDGIQVEQKEYWTTYCDGDQQGCEWEGPKHAASSQRSAFSRAGGRIYDLQDDYGFNISGMSGTGTLPNELGVDEFAILPGGELNSDKINSRVLTLTGTIIGTDDSDFHSKKQTLANILDIDTYPNKQPARIYYNGATVHKYIDAYYEDGLSANIQATDPCNWEQVAVRMIAPDPFFYEIGESAVSLDTGDSVTLRIVTARLRSTGQWDDLGPPNAAGTYTSIISFAEDATYVYVGGSFFNFDNIANADYIVRWHKKDQVWSALGTGMNDIVNGLTIGPDGTLYAIGNFTTAGGGAANRIASWNGSTWSALGSGLNAQGKEIAFGPDGTLYAAGSFTTAGGGAANYIASWNGSTWSALGSGLGAAANTVVITSNNILYVGGTFTTAGGGSANYIAKYDIDNTTWSALSTGTNTNVLSLALDTSQTLYIAGGFTTAGGETVNYITKWNGQSFFALAGGANNSVTDIVFGPDNILYASGTFTAIGGLDTIEKIAKWNGYSWSHLAMDFPSTPAVDAIVASEYVDPVLSSLYDIWLGFNTTGATTVGGKVIATNDGNAEAFPKIIYQRTSSTVMTLQELRNHTTGKELLYDYSLLDQEILTIDLASTKKSVVSSMFGSRQDAILPNSDFGNWSLIPGSNEIVTFNIENAAVVAYIVWKDKYKTQD